ncbi:MULTISPECIES: hypothetical protein [unclassified Mycolicibacterium]|uniref:hypothetical protein n=1 Tax=unclassified Mycolicibacterium TaxID=2636767 RepID=UPI0012DD97E1|nr:MULTISPECIES: hypothetical protein [unclassified Mycolicibacterium]MUL82711.1 hypothetical protein [Mycolicibacterium sp. CBMA 329]MUL89046.1 hypothetical protein [Mycolicibacterium sp. CBMA 331]MUL97613.1 hypothetical protein [Mycolicibacterium sp. CBMA 334]MUM26324.1 hypothetical protein [Mycolicibacterium sp. CBMA 295]MUM38562.1 hypothetical protein [Mycolicibacterium sp. CBMA 247]
MAEISARVSAPLSVDVRGRRGVGVSAVASALEGHALATAGLVTAEAGDVAVLVIAEVLKPEDEALLEELTRAGRPALVVLNKADLAGSGPGGPVATAHRRARSLRELAGVPVVPMVALLAASAGAALPTHLAGALKLLASEPADLTSADAFVSGSHRVPRAVRVELLERLDRFGIAHATLALSRGANTETMPGLFRRLSELDRVRAAIDAAAAPVRYRRARWALAELRAVGGVRGDEAVGRFLADDDTVIAVMAAAVDMVQADGLTVDPGTDRNAHLCRARRWQRYRDGPVNALHRSCGDDIVRGSLRLLGVAGNGR